jgi:hypothetical protein
MDELKLKKECTVSGYFGLRAQEHEQRAGRGTQLRKTSTRGGLGPSLVLSALSFSSALHAPFLLL